MMRTGTGDGRDRECHGSPTLGVFFRRRWRWLLVACALAVSAYAVAGYWLVPWLVRTWVPDYVPGRAGATLTLGEVKVDPFRLRMDIADARLDDGSPQPLMAAELMRFDLELASLWRRAWVLSEVHIQAPQVRAEIRADGSLNLADLLPEDMDPDAPWPDARIGSLSVAGGQIRFADYSRRGEPGAALLPLDFHLRDFRTRGDGGQFNLQAATEAGERLAVEGRLSLSPYASQGRLALHDLRLPGVQRFVPDALPFVVADGQADLAVDYRIALAPGQPLQLDLEIPRIDVRDLAIRAQDVDEAWIHVPQATVEQVAGSLQERRLAIGSIHAQGARLQAWREADGSLSVSRLLAPATAAADDEALDGWQVSLDRFALEQGHLALQDRTLRPAAGFELDALEVTARGLSADLQGSWPVSVRARINRQAPLRMEGTVQPASLAAELAVELGALPLQTVAAYLPSHPGLRIRTGDVAGAGKLVLRAAQGARPQIDFEGDGSLSRLEIAETSPARPLLSWKRVEASGLRYRMSPDSVQARRLVVHEPFARVVIDPDGNINLFQILGIAPPSLPVIGGADKAGRAAKAGNVAGPATDIAGSLAAMPVRVDEVDLVGGTLSVADYSIEPNFRANVQDLRGSIRSISTDPDTVTRIDLSGHVLNRFSPVQIQGESTVLAFDRHTDLRMSFKNIELPVFNPYSGRFAGYAIDKGKLTTELHYRIDDRALVADHHVVVDQLEWGEATDSKDKVPLPVKLGTALLKDRHGVIDLELPVTGSLDDPQFRIGPLVWQVLRNLVVKVVASPFAALGALFDGAEQAQFVDFAPGSAELTEASREGLRALADGLASKPGLTLEIPAATAEGLDAQALGEQHLRAALATAAGVAPDAFDYAALAGGARYKALAALYRSELGARAEFPDEVEGQEGRDAREQARIDWLESQLLQRHAASPEALSILARRRAEAVQVALLDDGSLEQSRAFMAADRGAQAHDGSMRMELKLQ